MVLKVLTSLPLTLYPYKEPEVSYYLEWLGNAFPHSLPPFLFSV